ncbi:hypothetical protein FRC02_012360 [Tulasnella sp. 418]|nr:hypothetical protein FRC02_012360 [Tulasnella sp. 418]
MATRSGAKSAAPTASKNRTTRTRKAAASEKEESQAEGELVTRLSNLKLQNNSTRTTTKPVAGPSRAASAKSVATAPQSRASPLSKAAGKRKATTAKHDGVSSNIANEQQNEDPSDASRTKRDRVVAAMAEFNKATQSLGVAVASGWKASTASETKAGSSSSKQAQKPIKREDLVACIRSGTTAIREVRTLQEEQSLDIEKACLSFIGKMISLELYSEALDSLVDMKPIMLKLYPHPNSVISNSPTSPSPSTTKPSNPPPRSKQPAKAIREPFSLAKHSQLHCFPLPEDGQVLDSILNILAMFQAYCLSVLAHLCPSDAALDDALVQTGNLLDWRNQYTASLETSRVDYVMNYSARTLSSCNLHHTTLLKVRLWALKCLLVPRNVDHVTFWNQSMKCAKAFLKAHTTSDGTPEGNLEASKMICSFFGEIVSFIRTRPDSSSLLKGSDFVTTCEFWIRFAKLIKDMDQMKSITELIKPSDQSEPKQESSVVADPNPEDLAALRARLARDTVFLQQLASTESTSDADSGSSNISEIIKTIPSCTSAMRNASSIDSKLSRALDDLNRQCEKLMRDERIKDRNVKDSLFNLMLAIVTHGEIVLSVTEKARLYTDQDLRDIMDGTIYGLFALATYAMSRSSSDAGYAVNAYRHLERSYTLARLDSTESLSSKQRRDYANILRAVSTSYHNHGRTLSTDGKDSASVQYWKRSAEIGAVLEYQMMHLGAMSHREEAAKVIKHILKDLKEVYGSEYPIRRARVLIRSLEHAYGFDDLNYAPSPIVINGLLRSSNLASDKALSVFASQYSAELEILLALQAHREHEIGKNTAVVLLHSEKALQILRGMLQSDSNPSSQGRAGSASKATTSGGKKPAAKGRGAAVAKTRAQKPLATKTPKKKAPPAPDADVEELANAIDAMAITPSNSNSIKLDDGERLYRLLESLACLSGLLGHTLSRVGFLDVMRMFCNKGVDDATGDKFVRASVDLAYEFAKLARVAALERSALAANAYAAIQLARDDITASIAGHMQALRLWNRAIDALLRLQHNPTATASLPASSSNPFAPSASPSESTSATEPPRQTTRDSWLDGVQWRLAEGLVGTLFAAGKANYVRGSLKAAEYFIQRANELATSLNSPVLLSRALAREAEKELAIGKFEGGHSLLVQAMFHWEQVPSFIGPDLADLRRLQANHSLRIDNAEDAVEIYSTADNLLVQLEKMFDDIKIANGETSLIGFGPNGIVPALTASVLGRYIWLMRAEAGEGDTYDNLLQRFLALPAFVETKIEENTLLGKLALEEVQARFEANLFLSSVTESVIAIPMGMSSTEGAVPPTSTREILTTLVNAEEFFWSCLEIGSSHGEVHQIREAALSLAMIRALQTSLGRSDINGSNIVAGLLDVATAPTLRRELGECIDHKLRDHIASDDLIWPSMNSNGTPSHPPTSLSKRTVFHEEEDEEDTDSSMRQYWEAVGQRYRSLTMDPVGLAASQINLLPETWTVVHISVTDDKTALFISRQRPGCEPVIFCLPLDRQGRRDGDDEHFSYEKAIEEFNDIKNLNDASAKNAKDVVTKEGRINWWAERGQLDTRLKELVENIEYCWLGAFKTILNDPSDCSPEQIGVLRNKFEKVFRRNGVISNEKRSQLHLRLDDAIVECFSTLSPRCRDEELEDLAYFILDLYQLHGVPIALSEIDIDQICVDLRTALEEFASVRRNNSPSTPPQDLHTFLVLDKHLQSLPWESIPALRGRPVSRIPSMSFLIDRLELVQHQQGLSPLSSSSKKRVYKDRIQVDPLKAFFVLNPSGDLGVTQATYEKNFAEMQKLGWKGITGRAPTEEEMVQALSNNDLMLYFGHGGGQQYIRSNKLRHLQKCAITMLWGCSSGAMKEMGDFDPMGTPNHYMLAGCPTLVVNLWDVTDREIDRVAQSVLEKLQMNPQNLGSKGRTDSQPVSVVRAVAESRDVPKLKYLTGAAPVVYGIPFYL